MLRRIRAIAFKVVITGLLTSVFAKLNGVTGVAGDRAHAMLEAIFDPRLAWLFWLGVGIILGTFLHSRGRRLEETSRGRLGGPSLFYIRWEVRAIRLAIWAPSLRWLSADIDQDLHDLNRILVDVHGFPSMPCTDFADRDGIARTAEYLRRIAPHLQTKHLEEGRRSVRDLAIEQAGSSSTENETQVGADVAAMPIEGRTTSIKPRPSAPDEPSSRGRRKTRGGRRA